MSLLIIEDQRAHSTMPFKQGNSDNAKRKMGQGSEQKGTRKRSSLECVKWTPSQLAVARRLKELEKINCWIPWTLDRKWLRDHPNVITANMLIGVDLARFEAVVLQRPGQLWADKTRNWTSVFKAIGFSWANVDFGSHFKYHGADSLGNKIPWINCHPTPTRCPLEVLNTATQPGVHCMRVRRRLSEIGCLDEEDSSDDGEAEAADEEDSNVDGEAEVEVFDAGNLVEDPEEAMNVAAMDGDECCLRLEPTFPEPNAGTTEGGAAAESPLAVAPVAVAAGADTADESPIMLNVSGILKRKELLPEEAVALKELLKGLEEQLNSKKPVSGVQRFEIQCMNNTSMIWVR